MTLPALLPQARGLTLTRASDHPDGALYSHVAHIPEPAWEALRLMLSAARELGHVTGPDKGGHGLLDVLDADGELLQFYAVPTAAGWLWWMCQTSIITPH